MTRINCIPVKELTGPHLVAEYRELPRVFGLVRDAIARGERPDDPRNPGGYRLGTGHVRFFYPRLLYLARRHRELVLEMRRRGYQPRFDEHLAWVHRDIPVSWWNDWTPDAHAQAVNRERIAERLEGMQT